MMQVIVGAHQLVLAFLMVAWSAPAVAASTATTTPVPGSCTPPSLGEHADVSACEGLIPPASCVVQCAAGYELTQGNATQALDGATTYYCYTVEDGFIGVGPECASAPTPAPTAPTPTPGISLELAMEVSNTSEFTMDNEPLKDALARGIAKTVDGVEASQVEILSIEVESDDSSTARRLSSGRVVVTSEINFAGGVPSSITASDLQGAATQLQQKINEELAASTSLTVSGLTATAKAKETAPTPAPTQSPSPTPASPDDETGFASSLGCSVSILALVAGVAAFRP